MSDRVVVIGGGFTGLVAARDIARGAPSAQVTLLEAGDQVGGLASGFPVGGVPLERSYHYLLTGDSEMLALTRELGLEHALGWFAGSVGIYDGARIHPFSTPLDLLRFPLCGLTGRVRLGLAIRSLQRRRDWQPLAVQTARDWLERECGPEAMQAVWTPLLRGKFDRYWDRISMAWLWARIHTRANSRSGARERLGYYRGGFAIVVDALMKDIAAAGGTVRTRARVARIATGPDRRVTLESGESLAYDHCLFTGPSDAFARVLPEDPVLDEYRARLRSITYLGAICVVLVTDQVLSREHWVNIHDPAAPFLVLVNHTALVGAESYGGRQVYYLGCYRPHDSPWFARDDQSLLDEWLAYLRRMFPNFEAEALQERHVFRFRNAQHVVECDYQQRLPAFTTPLPGVYLANFSQIFPHDRGTNFAVRDGRRLARMMLAEC